MLRYISRYKIKDTESGMELLKNKTAVITGAGRGIGKATAILFAKHGAKLMLTDIDKAPLDEVVLEAKSLGSEAVGIAGDVTKPDDCKNVMKAAAEKLGNGSIDILANVAGITKDNVIHKMTLEEWNFILNINLTGTFNCIQAASPYMRDVAKKEADSTGKIKMRSIINISSISGTTGNAGQINYAATKAGVVGITKTVAKEWARFNITCNAIAPGYIDTRLTQARKKDDDFGIPEQARIMVDKLQKETGLFRENGKPEDIANAILFFASDLASFVTGQTLTVAGGLIGTI